MTHFLTLALLLAQGPVPERALGPDQYTRWALADLTGLAQKAKAAELLGALDVARDLNPANFRYFAVLPNLPEADYVRLRRLLAWQVHQMSGTQSAVSLPEEVPGTQKLLLRIRLSDYNWNAPAWHAVANREPYYREPLIGTAVAALTRELIGEVPDVRTFHVYALVRADWFIRETLETLRSPSYYDLLYAEFRFPAGGKVGVEGVKAQTATTVVEQDELIPWPGGPYHDPTTGKVVPYLNPQTRRYENDWPKGSFPVKTGRKLKVEIPAAPVVVNVKEQLAIDFPKDKGDWNKAWGLDLLEDYFKQSKKRVKHGAVALGMGDDPKRGSFVARSNRLLTFAPSPNCVGGASLESFDVIDPVGKRDYVKEAPNLARGQIVFDAQELLVSMPNGAQAALLVAAEGKRVEFADPGVAIDTTDIVNQQAKFAGIRRRLDARVRTPGSCIVCHTATYGIIQPGRLIDDFYNSDLKNPLYIRDPILRKDFQSFYLGWQEKIEGLQLPMKLLVKQATVWPGAKPWTGLEVSDATFDARVEYDKSLALPQVLNEQGLTAEQFVQIVKVSINNPWLPLLLRGEVVPRRQYEVNVVPDLAKLAALTGAIPSFKEEKRP